MKIEIEIEIEIEMKIEMKIEIKMNLFPLSFLNRNRLSVSGTTPGTDNRKSVARGKQTVCARTYRCKNTVAPSIESTYNHNKQLQISK